MFDDKQLKNLENILIQDVIRRAVLLMNMRDDFSRFENKVKSGKIGQLWIVDNSKEAQHLQTHFLNEIVYTDEERLYQDGKSYIEKQDDIDEIEVYQTFCKQYKEIETINQQLNKLENQITRSKSLLKNMDQETQWLSKVNQHQVQKIDAFEREHHDYAKEYQKENEKLVDLEQTSTKLYDELLPTLKAYEEIKKELGVAYRSKTNLENQLNLFSFVFHPKNSKDIVEKLKELNHRIDTLEKKHLQLIDQKVKKERTLNSLNDQIDETKKVNETLKIKEENAKKELDRAIRENTIGSQHTQSFEKRYLEVKERITKEESDYTRLESIFEQLKKELYQTGLQLLHAFGKKYLYKLEENHQEYLHFFIPVVLMSGTRAQRFVEEEKLDEKWNVKKY